MIRCLYDIIPDPELFLALEPEELAGYILEFLNSQDDYNVSQLLNTHNFSLPHIVEEYPQQFHENLLKAIMEAWNWLLREGFLAPKPGSGKDGWVFITRRGHSIESRHNLQLFQKSNILPKNFLHPTIALKVWSAFIRGEYDTAVFQAFKEVEVAIRTAGHFEARNIGESLMRKAFDADSGPLTDQSLPEGERKAIQHLFAGAIGSYKNPHSHRNVEITDPVEAAEMIILASHLLKIVDYRSSTLLAEEESV